MLWGIRLLWLVGSTETYSPIASERQARGGQPGMCGATPVSFGPRFGATTMGSYPRLEHPRQSRTARGKTQSPRQCYEPCHDRPFVIDAVMGGRLQ